MVYGIIVFLLNKMKNENEKNLYLTLYLNPTPLESSSYELYNLLFLRTWCALISTLASGEALTGDERVN